MSDTQLVNPKEVTEYTRCRGCDRSLIGGEVAKSERRYVGEFTHHSQLVGLKQDSNNPALITHWKCPYCGFTFSRFF